MQLVVLINKQLNPQNITLLSNEICDICLSLCLH